MNAETKTEYRPFAVGKGVLKGMAVPESLDIFSTQEAAEQFLERGENLIPDHVFLLKNNQIEFKVKKRTVTTIISEWEDV